MEFGQYPNFIVNCFKFHEIVVTLKYDEVNTHSAVLVWLHRG